MEALVMFLLVLSINNYLKNPEMPIRADGMGYYEYLPSLFIFGDLNRHQLDSVPERIRTVHMYVPYEGHMLNKYPAGTALLMSPFFAYGHLMADLQGEPQDGYSKPYQDAMFFAILFYLFLGLLFLRKLLQLYDIRWYIIALVQLFCVFTTSIMHYVSFESTFSHIYSLFVINAFMYVGVRYFRQPSAKRFLWACLLLGVIVMIRQVNLLVLALVPFLAGSPKQLLGGVRFAFKRPLLLIPGLLISAVFSGVQMVLWYMQTGHAVVYSYQGESFNFLSPAFIDILFSYKKGLFVYTPSVFVALGGLIIWIKTKKWYALMSWLGFFILLTYVLSSWWSWEYGCSYGNRAFIDFYGVFFLLLAVLLQGLRGYWKIPVIALCLAFIPVSMIQTYQYKHFILDWIDMDETKYWEVFLRTEPEFTGLYFKQPPPPYMEIYLDTLIETRYHQDEMKTDTLFHWPDAGANLTDSIYAMQVFFENSFDNDQDAYVSLEVTDANDGHNLFYHEASVIVFKEERLDTRHQGQFNFLLHEPVKNDFDVWLRVETKKKSVDLDNVRLRFYRIP